MLLNLAIQDLIWFNVFFFTVSFWFRFFSLILTNISLDISRYVTEFSSGDGGWMVMQKGESTANGRHSTRLASTNTRCWSSTSLVTDAWTSATVSRATTDTSAAPRTSRPTFSAPAPVTGAASSASSHCTTNAPVPKTSNPTSKSSSTASPVSDEQCRIKLRVGLRLISAIPDIIKGKGKGRRLV